MQSKMSCHDIAQSVIKTVWMYLVNDELAAEQQQEVIRLLALGDAHLLRLAAEGIVQLRGQQSRSTALILANRSNNRRFRTLIVG
jgi:hypothetical protein